MVLADHRLRARVRDAASAAPDSEAFRQEVLDAIHAHVPFDATCLGGTDPYVLVPTSLTTRGYEDPRAYAMAVELEYGDVLHPDSFESLVRERVPVRTLRESSGDRARSTRRFADLLAPYGLRDEVRMVFRGSDGLVWGICSMSRRGQRQFDADEEALLGSVVTEIGDGLRAMLFRDSVHRLEPGSDGPAVAVLGPDNEFDSATPAALEYFERLAWGGAGSPVPVAPAAAVAARLRASGQESVTLRTRTPDGEWLLIRAGRLDGEHPPRTVVLTVERAQPPELVSLLAAAHGLTRRECQVLLLSLRGASRDEMAAALFISPYTVQDHLKSIFAKTGVNSRRSLVSRLVNTECLPRVGSAVGADGWFARVGPPTPEGP
ncbi:response regulator transcription factor [uncultured Phycicoccus sp.]|uniref:response regulator transcription factor n=1 Tax=uncultured Phycicoccus sp. TaxID=661422 RepID=UPI0026200A68|nr:helix-turn-helix transcriptional regulator [uncultured Phycicoccus sp.]